MRFFDSRWWDRLMCLVFGHAGPMFADGAAFCGRCGRIYW